METRTASGRALVNLAMRRLTKAGTKTIFVNLDRDIAREQLQKARTIAWLTKFRKRMVEDRARFGQMGEGVDVQNVVMEFQLRAERGVGILLNQNEFHRLTQGKTGRVRPFKLPSGVSDKDAREWQLEAEIRDDIFDKWVVSMRDVGAELTTAAVLRFHAKLFETECPKRGHD